MLPFIRPPDPDDDVFDGNRGSGSQKLPKTKASQDRFFIDLVSSSESESEGTDVDVIENDDDDDDVLLPARRARKPIIWDSDDEDVSPPRPPVSPLPPAQRNQVVIEISDDEDLPEKKKVHVAEINYQPPVASRQPQPSAFKIDMKGSCPLPPHKFDPRGWPITAATACDFYQHHPITDEWRRESWKELIHRVQRTIRSDMHLVKNPRTIMDTKDMATIFEAFDSVYFQGTLWQMVCSERATLEFELSKRHARIAGYCQKHGCRYRIHIYWKVFRQLFQSQTEKHFISNGLPCHTRLECFLNVFAHELCHLLIMRFCSEKKKSAHGPVFKQLAFQLFGHTDFQHELMTDQANTRASSEIRKAIQAIYHNNRNYVFALEIPGWAPHTPCVIIRLNTRKARIRLPSYQDQQRLVPYEYFQFPEAAAAAHPQ